MTIDQILNYLYVIINSFSQAFNFFESSISSLVDSFLTFTPIGVGISKLLKVFVNTITINGQPLGDVGLIFLILGWGLTFYVIYQFITWVLNSVT